MPMTEPLHPVLLLILDGWGDAPASQYNAISQATLPVWNKLWREHPHTTLTASGLSVGLPSGQMGNSEVGHTHLGAGRVVYQDLTRISKAITDGVFSENPVLGRAFAAATASGGRVHLMGLWSDGGVHSHLDHFNAMMEMALQQFSGDIFLHAFLDGRDTPPRSAAGYLQSAMPLLVANPRLRFASVCGRYYAMDRDQNGQRMQAAWDLLVYGRAAFRAESALQGVEMAYARGENDEFVQATCIAAAGQEPVLIADGDVVVFMNFRADRARQLTRALLGGTVKGLDASNPPRLADFVQLTAYAQDIAASVAFPGQDLRHVLGSWLAEHGLRQLRIAETEKYAHVTFFFNGGEEVPFPLEERILIPSPKVATFDLQPEMSANEITDQLVQAIQSQTYALIVCNYANGDQVGHTGLLPAAIRAVEAVDTCLGRILKAVQSSGSEMLITADHGNVECMFDPESGQPLTAHTTNPVPLLYVGPRHVQCTEGGSLVDVAPTLLALLGLAPPPEMTGKNLLCWT